MSEQDITDKVVAATGITAKQFKSEIDKRVASLGDMSQHFSRDTIAYSVASDKGVDIIGERLNAIKRRSESKKTNITDISTGMSNQKLTISGYVLSAEEGITRSDAPKIKAVITNGSSQVNTTIYGQSYNQYKELGINVLDKIKITGAQTFDFTPEGKDVTYTSINVGDYSTIKKIDKSITDHIPEYRDAKEGELGIINGSVVSSSVFEYTGCPECKKKAKVRDTEEDFECACGYKGQTVKHGIKSLNVMTNNNDIVDVSTFDRTPIPKKIENECVMMVVKNKKDRLTLMGLRVFHFNLEGNLEETPEGNIDEETSEGIIEETSEGNVSVSDFKNKDSINHQIKDVLEMFPSGMSKIGVIEMIKTKMNIKGRKVRIEIRKMKREGTVIEEDDNLILSSFKEEEEEDNE